MLFCIAAAITAAALADPLVEFASNIGFFGRGTFTDHSNLDVVPALFIGAAFVAALVAVRARGVLQRIACTAITRGNAMRLLPATFALQLMALLSMETIEQTIVYGHALGGAIWLGGPIVISLIVHALFCAIISLVAATSLRTVARAIARVVIAFRAFTIVAAQPLSQHAEALRKTISIARPAPLRRRIGERAPPLLAR